jgi:L-asparaginase II
VQQLTVLHLRGGAIESRHPITAALVTPEGEVLERVGAPRTTTFRSSAKPLQLEASLDALGPAAVDALEEADLAIGAASHHGAPMHVARVRRLLDRFGLEPSALRCGAHPPADELEAHALIRAGEAPSALHNNCSGKHAFMLAACRARGWTGDYREEDHPLQRAIRRGLEARGGEVERVAVDGCGVPTFALPLEGMARAYASLARAMAERRAGARPTHAPTSNLGRIGWAMQRHPRVMSGERAVDGLLIADATRPIVAKVGAEGLLCVALPEQRLGLALKVESANGDARAVAIHALLARLFPGLLPDGAGERYAIVRNHEGREVGRRVAHFDGP